MNQCEQLKQEYQTLKSRYQEFVSTLEEASDKTKSPEQKRQTLTRAKILKKELEERRDSLQERLWPFDRESFSKEKFNEQYDNITNGYRDPEIGILQTLSSGKEGIKDEQNKEHPIPSKQEIIVALRENKEFYQEKFETMENPRIHLTPFALSPETLKDKYADQIEEHFVEEKTEGDRRIPDPQKTKLFGANKEPLQLRTDKKNVYFNDDLKTLKYFPEWKQEGDEIKAEGGLTKAEAITQIGPWRLIIIEDMPLAPEEGEGKEKTSKTTGRKRKQVEGRKNAAEQYNHLKELQEEGLTPEDWLSFTMLHLREKNIVLDDDRGTSYYHRLLGAATASGGVPSSFWYRGNAQTNLGWNFPGNSDSFFAVRGSVRVNLKI